MNDKPKNLLILQILEILKKYSDAYHPMKVSDIKARLEKDYEVVVDRKAIRRNLDNLISLGYNIENDECARINKWGEEELVQTNWYLEGDFTDSELRLIIDSLLFSSQLPTNQCKNLIEKLQGLSNVYFKNKVKHVINLPSNTSQNADLLYSIEVLDEAIEQNKQVEFSYCTYDTDKKLRPRLNNDGTPKKYLVNPYQMVATNGKYYLIANVDKHDDVAHFRLDRIKDIVLKPQPRKPQNKVLGWEQGLRLPEHMAEHLYMFSGKSERVVFIAKKHLMNDLIDWFGKDIRISSDKTQKDEIRVETKVNLKAMKLWARQYGPYVKVISPKNLVDEIKEELLQSVKNYEEE